MIHSTADVSPEANVGSGTRVWNDAQIRERAVVGEDCVIGKGVYIDKDVVVGSRVKIQNRASLFRGLTVETAVVFLIRRLEVCTSTDVALRLQRIPFLNDPADDGEAGAHYGTNFGFLDYVVEGAAFATGYQCANDDSQGGTYGGAND